MKLFITNKSHFEDSMGNNFSEKYYTPREIHKFTYQHLQSSIAEGNIPIQILTNYKKDNRFDGDCIFQFVSVKNDVYYYEFITAIS